MTRGAMIWAVHLAALAVLFALQWVLPPYHVTNLARIMVLALFASAYNLAFGYTGLLSLGHALFFAAGMYAGGLPAWHWGVSGGTALLLGLLGGGIAALLVGLLALRTAGVAFMIVTLMFAQAFALTILYFNSWTGGDEGFTLPTAGRQVLGFDLSQEGPRFVAAWVLCTVGVLLALALMRSRHGRVLVALRENEERSRMLGYDPYARKLAVLVLSGVLSGLAGAGYAVLFGYAGGSFAAIQYSILPMLYVLMGGAGTVLGPLLGAAVMFYLIDAGPGLLAQGLRGLAGALSGVMPGLSALLADFAGWASSAWLFVVGISLILLVLFAPRGILGWVRAHVWRDLP
ncbi:branched-chain amino acid ABC transporter permease [Neotabrizicola sp. VNH66]|uniref:branched-chain amino acid ABC transporter permease n=1 Tax=Neotabrizicola sp. VNH66 TaxID=3400918 RepID=UPI003C0ECF81